MRNEKLFTFGLVLFSVFVFCLACGPSTVKKQESVLDTSENHFSIGMRLLDRGKVSEARAEFIRAQELNPKHAEGFAGLALVEALDGNFEQAHDLISKALGKNENSYESRVIRGRLFTLESKGDDWAEKADKEFQRAATLQPGTPKAYFYSGQAYRKWLDFSKAAEVYSKVISLKGDFAKEADEQYALMQKIQRAAPGTKIGMKISLIEEIDRADLAVLLIEEMKLGEVVAKKLKKAHDTGFKPPQAAQVSDEGGDRALSDVGAHWAKNWIEEAVTIGGMQPFSDNTFRPDDRITRANYSQVMQNILVLATGDDMLATKYIGENSRFPDVNSSNYAYNAMALMVDRGIVTTDTMTGEFDPEGRMSGADALLAIRKFQNALRLEFR